MDFVLTSFYEALVGVYNVTNAVVARLYVFEERTEGTQTVKN